MFTLNLILLCKSFKNIFDAEVTPSLTRLRLLVPLASVIQPAPSITPRKKCLKVLSETHSGINSLPVFGPGVKSNSISF